MYEQTNCHPKELLTAANAAAKLYRDSLLRQFVHNDKKGSHLRPSQLGKPAVDTFCRRFFPELYPEAEPLDPDFDVQQAQCFHMGDVVEAEALFHLIRQGYKIHEAQPKVTWYGVEGHADFIVSHPEYHPDPHVLEVKSSNKNGFSDMSRRGITRYSSYLTQLAIYTSGLKLPGYWQIYCKDNEAVMTIQPSIIDLKWARDRALKIVKHDAKIDKWEEVFDAFRPPVPRWEKGVRRWAIPLEMWGSPSRHLVYEIEEGENARGEIREYILGYKGAASRYKLPERK